MNFTITRNESFNSNEIYFTGIPAKEVRENLKAIGFRWHAVKKCWYGYKTEDEIRNAIENSTTTETADIINEYGVKVGDVFLLSWGYDQTNVNFFQVIEVTAKKARIVEVDPPRDTIANGPMSAHHTLTYKDGEMLPRLERPFWIKDNVKGDLKSIRNFSRDGIDPHIVISSRGCYTAYRVYSGKKVYESWYA